MWQPHIPTRELLYAQAALHWPYKIHWEMSAVNYPNLKGAKKPILKDGRNSKYPGKQPPVQETISGPQAWGVWARAFHMQDRSMLQRASLP